MWAVQSTRIWLSQPLIRVLCSRLGLFGWAMANLVSGAWQDETNALLLAVHGEDAPSDVEWDHYCEFIPQLLLHPNACSVVLTDGGAPTIMQRERMRKQLGTASRWTAVITDKAMVRGVVTAIRWFNPKVCAFAPWDVRDAFRFVGLSSEQIANVLEALSALDAQLAPRSRVLAESRKHLQETATAQRA